MALKPSCLLFENRFGDIQERKGLVLDERGFWVQGIGFVPSDEVANARHIVVAYDGLPGHLLGGNQLNLELAGLRLSEVGANLSTGAGQHSLYIVQKAMK